MATFLMSRQYAETVGIEAKDRFRTADEEEAEALLLPLRAEPSLRQDLVDFLVQRVAAGMLWARLEGRRDREFELGFELVRARSVANCIKVAPEAKKEEI